MKHHIAKAVWVEDLRKAVNLQFDCDFDDLTPILFGNECPTNCYKRYYFNEVIEYHGYSWEDEEDIRIRNLVNLFLKGVFPFDDYILIDISW